MDAGRFIRPIQQHNNAQNPRLRTHYNLKVRSIIGSMWADLGVKPEAFMRQRFVLSDGAEIDANILDRENEDMPPIVLINVDNVYAEQYYREFGEDPPEGCTAWGPGCGEDVDTDQPEEVDEVPNCCLGSAYPSFLTHNGYGDSLAAYLTPPAEVTQQVGVDSSNMICPDPLVLQDQYVVDNESYSPCVKYAWYAYCPYDVPNECCSVGGFPPTLAVKGIVCRSNSKTTKELETEYKGIAKFYCQYVKIVDGQPVYNDDGSYVYVKDEYRIILEAKHRSYQYYQSIREYFSEDHGVYGGGCCYSVSGNCPNCSQCLSWNRNWDGGWYIFKRGFQDFDRTEESLSIKVRITGKVSATIFNETLERNNLITSLRKYPTSSGASTSVWGGDFTCPSPSYWCGSYLGGVQLSGCTENYVQERPYQDYNIGGIRLVNTCGPDGLGFISDGSFSGEGETTESSLKCETLSGDTASCITELSEATSESYYGVSSDKLTAEQQDKLDEINAAIEAAAERYRQVLKERKSTIKSAIIGRLSGKIDCGTMNSLFSTIAQNIFVGKYSGG